jgi:hypothetical protein
MNDAGCFRIAALVLGLVLTGIAAAETVQPDQRWAFAPNAGWLDARPLGAEGPGLHAADGVIRGWLYAANVGWISAHCLNTASCSRVDYGLRLESIPEQPDLLRLVGRLWSPNAGWITAHCLTSASCAEVDYGLYVDIESGLIDGFAWSENFGWISFSCANTESCGTAIYGVGLLPEAIVPVVASVFSDGFES